MTGRENWGSRFGFVMAAAGSAVGLGNIWRFPYTTGENGGGAFLLIYLAIVAAFGLSLVMAEIVMGRTAQRNPVGAFRLLGGRGWPLVGFLGVATGFIILSFYIVVAGWTLAYVVYMARGLLVSTDPAHLGEVFGGFIASPLQPLIYAAAFVALIALVVSSGVGKGIERANKLLMPMLFVLLLILAVRALTLPGAGEGLRFFLVPDFSKVTAATFSAALAQAFFSLSLGMGCMLTYGSYLNRRENIPGSAAMIVGLDVTAAMLAGLVILPVVFAFGFDPSAGPGLTFVTLPAVFASMPGGAVFGVMFFVLLAIAALTSAVSILEPVISYLIDERGMSRRHSVLLCTALCFALGIPSSLSFGVWSGFTVFDRSFFDLMDFLATSVMMPLGALLTSIFVGWFWAAQASRALTNEGELRLPWIAAWTLVIRFVAPVALTWILLISTGVI
jgi:neurotransmitter:Na+ symporter, NSS family